ncbi:ATP-binding protein [Blastopirellula marina]|uniref:histidine kinase n=1 Tax=Blastopirellula marina DSM 3645 TaxID=314230 RepID=A3ZNT3_9BACT|nr:ATP-binding protein [Blastopirellula marina]EAQ81981.1 sensory transduction histidine kinase [Blastopirellula marina DSM 3645]
MKLTTKFYSLLIVLMISTLLVGYLASRQASEVLRNVIISRSAGQAQSVIDEIDRMVHTRIAQWRAYSESPQIRRALQDSNAEFAKLPDVQATIDERDQQWRSNDPAVSKLSTEIDALPLSQELARQVALLNDEYGAAEYGEVFITNRYGANVAETNRTSDYRQNDETWWRSAKNEGIYVDSVAYDESVQEYAISLCLRIDDAQGDFLGVLKTVISIHEIVDVIDQSAKQDSVLSISLIDAEKKFIYHSAYSSRTPLDQISPLAGLTHTSFGPTQRIYEYASEDGTRILSIVAESRGSGKYQGLGWEAIVEQAEDSLMAPLTRLRWNILGVALLLASIALGISWLVGNRLRTRIARLSHAAKRIGDGEFGLQVDDESHDELNDVVRQFNAMSWKIVQSHDELLAAQHRAESANLAKSRFLATMSHELRTPMTAILGFTENLLESPDYGSLEERNETLNTILRNGEHLLGLIDDVLDLSKIEAGRTEIQTELCSPGQIANEVIGILKKRAASRRLTLRIRCKTPIPAEIETDALRLRQILLNLVGNALKFTEKGGISLELSSTFGDVGRRMLRVRVEDTGPGIPSDQLEHIFEPFVQVDSTTSRSFGGAGLGLPISRRLAELLGGTLIVESTIGTGSAFTLSVPVGDIEGIPFVESIDQCLKSHSQPSQDMPPRIDANVLLVEDSRDAQLLIRTILERAGAKVTLATNGVEALERMEIAEELALRYDVILMDMQMPMMDGYTATEKLRGLGCQIPIIALTAQAMEEDRQRCLDVGCTDYQSKPIHRKTLLKKIHLALSDQQQETVISSPGGRSEMNSFERLHPANGDSSTDD